MKRGEIWVVDLNPIVGHGQEGKRPALIVSAVFMNQSPAGLVTLLPITSKPRRLPSRVPVAPTEGGLTMESWVITERIRTVSKQRLVSQLGVATVATMGAVDTCLMLLLELE